MVRVIPILFCLSFVGFTGSSLLAQWDVIGLHEVPVIAEQLAPHEDGWLFLSSVDEGYSVDQWHSRYGRRDVVLGYLRDDITITRKMTLGSKDIDEAVFLTKGWQSYFGGVHFWDTLYVDDVSHHGRHPGKQALVFAYSKEKILLSRVLSSTGSISLLDGVAHGDGIKVIGTFHGDLFMDDSELAHEDRRHLFIAHLDDQFRVKHLQRWLVTGQVSKANLMAHEDQVLASVQYSDSILINNLWHTSRRSFVRNTVLLAVDMDAQISHTLPIHTTYDNDVVIHEHQNDTWSGFINYRGNGTIGTFSFEGKPWANQCLEFTLDGQWQPKIIDLWTTTGSARIDGSTAPYLHGEGIFDRWSEDLSSPYWLWYNDDLSSHALLPIHSPLAVIRHVKASSDENILCIGSFQKEISMNGTTLERVGESFGHFIATLAIMETDDTKTETSISYPNPTTGIIYLTNLSDVDRRVNVYDSNGQWVRSYDDVNDHIDLSALKDGLYILRYHADTYEKMSKVLIIR